MEHALYTSDSDLLVLISQDDESAFTELYNRYNNKLYQFLIRMVKSPEVAEELLFDIFTKLWTGRAIITEIKDLDAFLSKVAYNKAISFFRMAASQKKLRTAIAYQMETEFVSDTANRLLESEIKEIIQEAIQQLSPQRKAVFTMSREQGLTHEQIADQLNLSVLTVKKTMSIALQSIKNYLKTKGLDSSIFIYWYIYQY